MAKVARINISDVKAGIWLYAIPVYFSEILYSWEKKKNLGLPIEGEKAVLEQ